MNGFVNCSARLLVAGLTAGLLAPLPAATIAFSYDVTGTSGSTKVNSTTVDYEATATGSATPLGTANFTTVGVLRATSSNTGTITGTLTCTFGNGDSIQGSYSQVPFSLGASGSGSSTGNATITGGTGGFKNAT